MRYDIFEDDTFSEINGHEWTIPFGALYKGERLLLQLESAYSLAKADYGLNPNPEISSMTDTRLAASYSFPDLPVGIVIGVDVNLPTGQERLSRYEQVVEAGEQHDLFEVDNFGEGLNVGVNLGLAKAFGDVTMGLSGAYLLKGEYDPTKDVEQDDLDPGDHVVVLGIMKWKAGGGLTVETTAAYSHVSPDTINGEESFREGPKLLLGGTLRFQGQTLGIRLGMQNTFPGKNKELVDSTLKTEPENSNGNEFLSSCDVTCRVSSKLDLQLLGDLRLYGESDRKNDENGLPFKGKRVRYAIGPGALYLLNDHLTWNAVMKYFIMKQEQDIYEPEEMTLRGLNLSLGMTYMF